MSKNILFSNTSWRSHLMRETSERRTADEQKEDKCNKVTSFQTTPDHEHYASEKLLFDSLQTIVERIVQEINRAYESENFIYNELLKEKSFAEECDAALKAAIESEEKRASDEENAIKKSLGQLQQFVEYKNLLQLNSLIMYGYSAIGTGEAVNAVQVFAGCYNSNGELKEDASILTSIYQLPLGQAYRLNCDKLEDDSLANILLYDNEGNICPFTLELKDTIFVPDRAISRIGLSYKGTAPTVESFNLENIVATVADGTVDRSKLSTEMLEEIANIAQSVINEMKRAINSEESIKSELQNQVSSNAVACEKTQSQLENEIIRSTVVDKNLLNRVEKLESRCVVLSETEYNSIEYKNNDTIYFVIEE